MTYLNILGYQRANMLVEVFLASLFDLANGNKVGEIKVEQENGSVLKINLSIEQKRKV